MRVVIINADARTRNLLRFVLTEAGYTVQITESAGDGLVAALSVETDAVLLDVDLPDMDGFRLCKQLRSSRYAGPIIFVTRHRDTAEKLLAFSLGADDFIVHPFDPEELVARVEVVSRRCKHFDLLPTGTLLAIEEAELNITDLTFRFGERDAVVLTPTEMRLLECLMRNAGIAISRETLIERTWGYDCGADSNRVDVYVARLRKKLVLASGKKLIDTVRGVGYVFRSPERKGTGKDVVVQAPKAAPRAVTPNLMDLPYPRSAAYYPANGHQSACPHG